MRTRARRQLKLIAVRVRPTTWQALTAVAAHRGQKVQSLAEQILAQGLARLIEGKHA